MQELLQIIPNLDRNRFGNAIKMLAENGISEDYVIKLCILNATFDGELSPFGVNLYKPGQDLNEKTFVFLANLLKAKPFYNQKQKQ